MFLLFRRQELGPKIQNMHLRKQQQQWQAKAPRLVHDADINCVAKEIIMDSVMSTGGYD